VGEVEALEQESQGQLVVLPAAELALAPGAVERPHDIRDLREQQQRGLQIADGQMLDRPLRVFLTQGQFGLAGGEGRMVLQVAK
jgi:hypothetical protein